MKKLFAVMLVVAVVFVAASAWPDDGSKITFDNVTFSKPYKIKGYATVTLLGFKFIEAFAQWEDGKAGSIKKGGAWCDNKNVIFAEKLREAWLDIYVNCALHASGQESDFAWLKADILNLQKEKTSFMKDIAVNVIYNDEYEFDGWVRQFNYDYSKAEIYVLGETSIGWPVCLSPVDEMPIAPMYKGHYAFGCTLPNFVVEDKDSPLRMEITIGGHKLTYNIR
ncbi:MAG: hypothetical protein IJT02_10365 [Synergistaceae bacterium]|nr:hypothetical protein [Synergistaceae bacterium]